MLIHLLAYRIALHNILCTSSLEFSELSRRTHKRNPRPLPQLSHTAVSVPFSLPEACSALLLNEGKLSILNRYLVILDTDVKATARKGKKALILEYRRD